MDPTFEDSELPETRKRIPGERPTEESLLAECAALGDTFSPAPCRSGDLAADASEMLRARRDLADLQARGFEVTQGHFDRIELSLGMISRLEARTERARELGKLKTASRAESLSRLLRIRKHLALLGRAAHLPAQLFSLDTKTTQRFNLVAERMDIVLANTIAVKEQLPDKKRVEALVIECRDLLDRQREAVQDAALARVRRSQDTLTRARLERLLFDTLSYLSIQGLAAYPDDPEREPIYRLDHIYGSSGGSSASEDETEPDEAPATPTPAAGTPTAGAGPGTKGPGQG